MTEATAPSLGDTTQLLFSHYDTQRTMTMKTLSRKISDLNCAFRLHLDRPNMSDEEYKRYRIKADKIIENHKQAIKLRRGSQKMAKQ